MDLPPWLLEGATKAALKQGHIFEEMARLVLYEYVEKHAPETLSAAFENIPNIVRLANSIIVSSIQKGASEIRLIPGAGEFSVVIQVDGDFEELFRLGDHVRPQLFDRFITMASNGVGVRQPGVGAGTPELIKVTSRGRSYDLVLEWTGRYENEMVLRFA